jgi:hypothetical protein
MDGRVARWFMAAHPLGDKFIIEKQQVERSLLYNT